MPTVLQNIFRFVLLVLFQVLVLNNIQFLGYINPYLYILFILALPVQMPRWFLLVLAFIIGLTIDIFSNTIGMHAFATVFVAFLRDGIIKLFTNIEEGNNPTPSFHTFGVSAYVKYIVVMVLIHHATLFILEAFSFAHFWLMLVKILISSLITIMLILGIQSIKTR
ncbi:MAG: rod shape-determining protein MreD [Bacteroidota bacterium]|nr:rod shape-determining protein MreD [Bacteroidota bacterium]